MNIVQLVQIREQGHITVNANTHPLSQPPHTPSVGFLPDSPRNVAEEGGGVEGGPRRANSIGKITADNYLHYSSVS